MESLSEYRIQFQHGFREQLFHDQRIESRGHIQLSMVPQLDNMKAEGLFLVHSLVNAFFVYPSLAFVMPSPQFLEAFAMKFQTDGIRVALPEENSNRHGIPALMKHLRY